MTSASIAGAPSQDRRRHHRHMAPVCQLTVGGEPAVLVDWSFGGLGVRVISGLDRFRINGPVSVSVFRQQDDRWERLTGRVQRIDAGQRLLGIALDDDGAGSVRVLLELLSARLDGEGADRQSFTRC